MNTSDITLILVSIILLWLIIHSILNIINKPDALGRTFKGGALKEWLPLNDIKNAHLIKRAFINAVLGEVDFDDLDEFLSGPKIINGDPVKFESEINKLTNGLFGTFNNYNIKVSLADGLKHFYEFTLTPNGQNTTYNFEWKILVSFDNSNTTGTQQRIFIGLVIPNNLIVRIV